MFNNYNCQLSMKQQKSFSVRSNSFLSTRRQEESILSEYKRAILGQDSFYFEGESIQYSPLPEFWPSQFRKKYTHSICLEINNFYEVFTISIFEYLLRSPTPKKVEKVDKFKNMICSKKFLSEGSYMKGLLLKGLKAMIESSQNEGQPVAQCLLGSDKIAAFTECWKEMIAESTVYVKNANPSSKLTLSVLATFFDVELEMCTIRGQQIEADVIKSMKKTKEKTAAIPLVLMSSQCSNWGQSSMKEESFSSISSIQGYWSYYLLVNYPDLNGQSGKVSKKKGGELGVRKHKTLLVEYPQLFAIDEENFVSSKRSSIVTTEGEERQGHHNIMKEGENLILSLKGFLEDLQAE